MTTARTNAHSLPAMHSSNADCDGERLSALTTRLARGDEAAYREFHEAYGKRLFRYAVTLANGDESVAKDILQDGWMRVVRHMRRFEEEPIFWCWLTRILKTAAADHGRKQSRYRRFLDWFKKEPSQHLESAPNEALLHHLQSVIEHLRPEDRALLTARYENGASIAEIADQLHLSREAVASRLARLKRRLRRSLGKQRK